RAGLAESVIRPLHGPSARLPMAVFQEMHSAERMTFYRQASFKSTGHGPDLPTGYSSRLTESPGRAAVGETGYLAFFYGQLQPAGFRQADVPDLANHGGEPFTSERFFHGP